MSKMVGPTDKLGKRQDSWSRYWASGSLQACIANDEEKAQSLLAFWHDFFRNLTPESRVLDIATGNGTLLKLALDSPHLAEGICFEAIDLAVVSPSWLQGLPSDIKQRIHFHGKIAAESLPFPDQSIDVAISQYGVEYTEWGRSMPELARVLKPLASIAFVIHDESSLIVRQAREEREHLSWLSAHGFFVLAEQMARFMALASTSAGRAVLNSDEMATNARSRFNAFLKEAQSRAAKSSCPDVLHETLQHTMKLLQQCSVVGTPEHALSGLDSMSMQHADMLLRQTELINCAQDEVGVRKLLQLLPRSELLSLQRICIPQGDSLGWAVLARMRG